MRDEGVPTTTTKTNEVTDIKRDNTLCIADEVAKVQPQFAQSISNLRLDNIQTERSMIQIAFANQKELRFVLNNPQPQHSAEQVARQSIEVKNNLIRSVGTFNQLSSNALDSTRENVKIYNRTVDAFADFNNNMLKTWASHWNSQHSYNNNFTEHSSFFSYVYA